MASTNSIKILEVCQVIPCTDSPESESELSLPLTFFDMVWLKHPPPIKRIFFYKLTESTPTFFNTVILPKLKHSLSLTLLHFLPLAGNLTWPPQATKPTILYNPNNGVSLTVAESCTDFDHLSGNKARVAVESHPYVPKLSSSDSTASILSLQITLFPCKGFSVAYAMNHAVLDGKTILMFMKAWADLCKQTPKQQNPGLVPELIPFFDRTSIQDPQGFDMEYLVKCPGSDPDPRSLRKFPAARVEPNIVRATFELCHEDIKKIKEVVVSKEDKNQVQQLHLSSFVLTVAYTLVCMVKAKGIGSNKKVRFGFAVDLRARLNPKIPMNYFGNCIVSYDIVEEVGGLMGENGVGLVAKRVSDVIKGLENIDFQEANKATKHHTMKPGVLAIWVAGSPKFDLYGVDFGWGRPTKVELTTIDRSGAFSLTESKDGRGGVEIGIALKKHEMDVFDSLFVNGLKDVLLSTM